jgi:hypothetical protein
VVVARLGQGEFGVVQLLSQLVAFRCRVRQVASELCLVLGKLACRGGQRRVVTLPRLAQPGVRVRNCLFESRSRGALAVDLSGELRLTLAGSLERVCGIDHVTIEVVANDLELGDLCGQLSLVLPQSLDIRRSKLVVSPRVVERPLDLDQSRLESVAFRSRPR